MYWLVFTLISSNLQFPGAREVGSTCYSMAVATGTMTASGRELGAGPRRGAKSTAHPTAGPQPSETAPYIQQLAPSLQRQYRTPNCWPPAFRDSTAHPTADPQPSETAPHIQQLTPSLQRQHRTSNSWPPAFRQSCWVDQMPSAFLVSPTSTGSAFKVPKDLKGSTGGRWPWLQDSLHVFHFLGQWGHLRMVSGLWYQQLR